MKPFIVSWKNLEYQASRDSMLTQLLKNRSTDKVILNGVNGFFESGQITGIMGPSGCGKSTLLTCISGGKKQGLTGSITIDSDQNVKFAFIVQDNFVLERLTVRESLLFASKLKNKPNADHKKIVNDVIDKLMISVCTDTRNNRCSGRQLKRVLIGLELVSKPNVLVLDEPTSGLDSSTTTHLIQTLVNLVKNEEAVAVVLTIHLPSAKVFNAYDKIYLLSCEGQSIYCGPPLAMNDQFRQYGLNCPPYCSIADFALEVASKEHGIQPLSVLSTIVRIETNNMSDKGSVIRRNVNPNPFKSVFVLTQRSFLTMIRDPYSLSFRAVNYIACGIFLGLMYGDESSQYLGCHSDWVIEPGVNMVKKWVAVANHLGNNFSFLCFSMYFAFIASISSVLMTFPMEFSVFLQEYRNGHFSGFAYFLSKLVTELSVNIVLPNTASLLLFFITRQYIGQWFRLTNYMLIFNLLSIDGSALGFMISAAIPKHPLAAMFVGLSLLLPQMIFSGVMVPLHQMKSYMRLFTWLDNMRFGFEACIVNVYGFDRCLYLPAINETDIMSLIPMEKMLEIYASVKINSEALLDNVQAIMGSSGYGDNKSLMVGTLQFTDYNFYFGIAMLILHINVYYLLAYIFIRMK